MSAPSPAVEPTGAVPRVSRASAWPVEMTTTAVGSAGISAYLAKWTTVRGRTPSSSPLPLPSGMVRGVT